MSNETKTEPTKQTTANDKNKAFRQELGALWKREGRNQTYLSGYIIGANGERKSVVVFSSKSKLNDRQPDYRIYESLDPKPQNGQPVQTTTDKKPDVSDKKSETASADPKAQSAESQDEDLL